jgi:hypothetical protein
MAMIITKNNKYNNKTNLIKVINKIPKTYPITTIMIRIKTTITIITIKITIIIIIIIIITNKQNNKYSTISYKQSQN